MVYLFSSMTSVYSINPSDILTLVNEGVPAKPLKEALAYYKKAKHIHAIKKRIITLIDFKRPSDKKRLWVIDLKNLKILYYGLVTHGKNSGKRYATHFSNKINSYKSSIGAMITGKSYHGKFGLAVRIHGLEKGVNDMVNQRAVVFHSSTYATPSYLKKTGHLGRSLGCFAINPKHSKKVFKTIQGGSFIYVYA